MTSQPDPTVTLTSDSVTVTLTVTVAAPTRENARSWAQTLADLVHAEHGHHMRLSTRIDDEPADNDNP